MKKSRVLLSCYACEPDKGSEPGVGWNWALAMSEKFKVRVLTRSNNQNAIRQALLDIQKPNLSFLYYDLPQWVLTLKKKRPDQHFSLLYIVAAWREEDDGQIN